MSPLIVLVWPYVDKIFWRNAVAVILKVAYGYQITSNDDPLVHLLEKTFPLMASITTPGKYLVEFLPIRMYFPIYSCKVWFTIHSTVRFIPDWFPGAGFKRRAKEVGRETSIIERVPFDWAKAQIVRRIYWSHFIFRRRYSPGNGWLCRVIHLKAPSFWRWTACRWGNRTKH